MFKTRNNGNQVSKKTSVFYKEASDCKARIVIKKLPAVSLYHQRHRQYFSVFPHRPKTQHHSNPSVPTATSRPLNQLTEQSTTVLTVTMSDELFELRNYFYLGNLTAAITEGETVSVDDQKAQIEREVILKRIELAKGNFDSIIASVADADPPALQVIKLLAQLIKDPSFAESASAALQVFTADEVAAASPCFLLMCATVYAHLGDFDNALRTANRVNSLEELALKVQVLLKMDRADMAQKEVIAMQAIDEDATLTQLATAWTYLYQGGDKVQEAIYIYQDLLERHGATDQVLNGMAVCHLAMGRPDESERVLTEALTKNPNCATSLINVICTSKYKNKPAELVARYFAQLQTVAPTCEWLLDYKKKEAEFDELAQQLVTA